MAWLHAVLDVPASRHAAGAEFWGAALGWPPGPAWPGHPELRSFEPGVAAAAYVHLQQVDAPPRVHLDLEASDREATVAAAVALGAGRLATTEHWTTLTSPGGLPFCVIEARDARAPGPVRWPDGHRTRLVQLCIDSPAERHDDEVAFWRAVLEGRWVDSQAEEFAGKWHDDAGSPIQLLFQRLGEADGVVRAHVDLGTDHLQAEVRRLVGLGADDIGPGPGGWHVLRDPVGLAFCVTENSPEQGGHRDLG